MHVPGWRHLKPINPCPSQMSFNNSPVLETGLTVQMTPKFIIWAGFVSNNPLNKEIQSCLTAGKEVNAFAPKFCAEGLGCGAERERDPDSPLPQLTSKDGAVISMGADVQFRVWDPVLSVMMVKDLIAATRMTAQNAMTKTLVKKSLREIQVEKLRIGEQMLVRTLSALNRAPLALQTLRFLVWK